MLGNWIAASFEQRRAENERRYLTYQEYLKERLATIQPTLERVGHTVAAAEDLITITRPDFDPDAFNAGNDREQTVAKRTEVRETYNEADVVWRREKEKLGYLLVYYHSGAPEVSAAWNDLESAVTIFVDCARSWWVEHEGGPTEEAYTACQDQRNEVDQTMAELVEVMGADISPMAPRP